MKCDFCRKIYDKNNGFGSYCSKSCYHKAYYRDRKVKKVCKICSKEFQGTKNEVYCSTECKRIALSSKDKVCSMCGTKFKGGRNSKYCSEICYRLANGSNINYEIKKCYVCGKSFTDKKSENSITCSKECESKKVKVAVDTFIKSLEELKSGKK